MTRHEFRAAYIAVWIRSLGPVTLVLPEGKYVLSTAGKPVLGMIPFGVQPDGEKLTPPIAWFGENDRITIETDTGTQMDDPESS